MWSFAAVLFLLLYFVFALCERKTKYRYNGKCLFQFSSRSRPMQALRHPPRLLLAALALGVCADQLFYGRWLGVSAPLFVALGLAALASLAAIEERAPTRANLWLGGAALFFALCLAWRDAPALAALNLLTLFGLL